MRQPSIPARPSSARAIWLALAVLCVILKPAIGFAGELHRDLHAAAHAGVAATTAAASPAIDGDVDEHAPASGWHALMHVDLCCGNAALPSTIDASHFVATLEKQVARAARVIPPRTYVDVFRPPITG